MPSSSNSTSTTLPPLESLTADVRLYFQAGNPYTLRRLMTAPEHIIKGVLGPSGPFDVYRAIIRSWEASYYWNEDLVNLFLSEVERQDKLHRIETGLSDPVDHCLTWTRTLKGFDFWSDIKAGRLPVAFRKD